MKIILVLLTIIGGVVTLSCNSNEKQQAAATKEAIKKTGRTDTTEVFQAPTVSEYHKINEDEIIKDLPVKKFVIIDSTNFDNYRTEGVVDNAFIKRIKFQTSNTTAEQFRIRYRVLFSDNFNAIVITYRDGEHELITTLVTLDRSGHIIDQLDIAYDEVAESAFCKIGRLEKDRICIQSWNYMSEVPTHEETVFLMLETGRFKSL
ncbi:hypothetical protein [Sphingobacterium faecale]|uniref:Lipoprotein n=1 Tax=Sphingobacterium faecale TaxID=2803775 RepID=A0ABS1R4E8_9SPHI|nr:hypothetical protein [Sphingobacterium faecale]MBL1409365.1 hypothetical protein [Sphingobacterium faecale]